MTTTQTQQAEQAASAFGIPVDDLIDQFSLDAVRSSKEYPAQKIIIFCA